jgi:hypothetical protein
VPPPRGCRRYRRRGSEGALRFRGHRLAVAGAGAASVSGVMVEGEPPPGAGAAGVASMMGAGTKAAARPEIEREEKHVPRRRSALPPPLSS